MLGSQTISSFSGSSWVRILLHREPPYFLPYIPQNLLSFILFPPARAKIFARESTLLIGSIQLPESALPDDEALIDWPGNTEPSGTQGGIPSGAIRMGDRKPIQRYEDGGLYLYNLKGDFGELNDLAKKHLTASTP